MRFKVIPTLLLTVTILVSETAKSADCPALGDLAKAIAAIKKESNCIRAKNTAIACAIGAVADVQLAGVASDVCSRDFKSISKSPRDVFDRLIEICKGKYKSHGGSVGASKMAFCELEVHSFYSYLFLPDENEG